MRAFVTSRLERPRSPAESGAEPLVLANHRNRTIRGWLDPYFTAQPPFFRFADTAECQQRVREAARTSLDHWWQFFDGVERAIDD